MRPPAPRWGLARRVPEGTPRATTHETPPSASIGSRGALRVSETAPAKRRDPRARTRFRINIACECAKSERGWAGGGPRFEPNRGPRAAATSGKNTGDEDACGGRSRVESTLPPGGVRRMATDEHAGWRESQLDAPNPFATLNQLTTPFTFSPEGFSGGSASAPAVSSATDASSFGVSAYIWESIFLSSRDRYCWTGTDRIHNYK